MELSDRKKKILKAVIDDYIDTAEPVGSKAISTHSGLGLSSATIRNELAELTSMGYLEQPHTSAGRVPSPQGYRIYVNELMRRHRLSVEESERITLSLRMKMQRLDQILTDVGRLTSNLTNYPAYALVAKSENITAKKFGFVFVDTHNFIVVTMLQDNSTFNKLMHSALALDESFIYKLDNIFNSNFTGIPASDITREFIVSMESLAGDSSGIISSIAGYLINLLSPSKAPLAYVTGTAHILEHPEYRDWDKAHKLLDYLSDEDSLSSLPAPEGNSPIKILIGPENVAEELKDSSVVVSSYPMGDGMQGLLGVVGPTRMDYAKVAARLSYITNVLRLLLSGDAALGPPGNGKE